MTFSGPFHDLFLGEVHRRHPDVDLVALPDDPVSEVGGPVDPDLLAVLLAEVGRVAADLATVIEQAAEPEPPAGPGREPLVGSWRFTGRAGEVRATDRRSWPLGDGPHVLQHVRRHLQREGWRIERPQGGLDRLTAERDGVSAQFVVAERAGVVTLVVTSEPLAVGADRARELVRGHLRVVEE